MTEPEGQADGVPALRQDPLPAPTGDRHTGMRLDRWQKKVLPFLLVGMLMLGMGFFGSTLWNYQRLVERMKVEGAVTQDMLVRVNADVSSESKQAWVSRVLLEERLMRHRYEFASINLQARVWTRFMGFLVGMVLVLSGCLFILARMEISFQGQASMAQSASVLKTNSPGIVLATLGTILLGLALTDKVSQGIELSGVYISGVQVEEVESTSTPERTPASGPAATSPGR